MASTAPHGHADLDCNDGSRQLAGHAVLVGLGGLDGLDGLSGLRATMALMFSAALLA